MKVSIIIPVYKVSAYIDRCIKSVMNQTYNDIECIIVDDATPDDSILKCEQMISEYDGPIRFFILHHQQNRGLSAARNTGTEVAKGEYLYYLDSDDEITLDCIEKLMKPIKEDCTIDLVQGNHMDEKDGQEICYHKRESSIYISINDDVYKEYYIYHHFISTAWNKLIKRSYVKKYKLYFKEGLLNEDFVQQLKMAGTFNEDSFDRQYRSIWSGDAENAFFSAQKFDKYRTLRQPQYEYSGRTSKNAYYVIGVDVGRIGCTTQATIFKVTPQPQGVALKSLVNIYTYDAQHFEQQAINIKQLFYRYKARSIALDTNGLGIGLLDFMVKAQETPDGQYLPPFGIQNDDQGVYKKYFKGVTDVQKDAIFQIKANAPINTQAYSFAQTQMSSGKIKFLIDEAEAKAKLMETKQGQNMTPDKRNEYLKPFVLTTILREQMLNLVEDNEGVNIILKQENRGIKKDKFSSFVYGLYYIKQEEDRRKKRKGRDISKLLLFS